MQISEYHLKIKTSLKIPVTRTTAHWYLDNLAMQLHTYLSGGGFVLNDPEEEPIAFEDSENANKSHDLLLAAGEKVGVYNFMASPSFDWQRIEDTYREDERNGFKLLGDTLFGLPAETYTDLVEATVSICDAPKDNHAPLMEIGDGVVPLGEFGFTYYVTVVCSKNTHKPLTPDENNVFFFPKLNTKYKG